MGISVWLEIVACEMGGTCDYIQAENHLRQEKNPKPCGVFCLLVCFVWFCFLLLFDLLVCTYVLCYNDAYMKFREG